MKALFKNFCKIDQMADISPHYELTMVKKEQNLISSKTALYRFKDRGILTADEPFLKTRLIN